MAQTDLHHHDFTERMVELFKAWADAEGYVLVPRQQGARAVSEVPGAAPTPSTPSEPTPAVLAEDPRVEDVEDEDNETIPGIQEIDSDDDLFPDDLDDDIVSAAILGEPPLGGGPALANPVPPMLGAAHAFAPAPMHETHDAAQPGADIDVPVLQDDPTRPRDSAPTLFGATFVGEDGTPTIHVSTPADERWYVVIKGLGFHGVVRGAHNYAPLVAGIRGAQGFRMRTREEAETAWRSACIRGVAAAL